MNRASRRRTAGVLGLAAALAAGVAAPQGAGAFPWSQDMKNQPSVKTQEMPRAAAPGAVPRTGRELVPENDESAARMRNPVAPSAESIKRGEAAYMIWCIACHGRSAVGNGPVAAKFVPPPDLRSEHTRSVTDGWIYAHIRRGGPMMPSYRYALPADKAWDLVNYVRSLQKAPGR